MGIKGKDTAAVVPAVKTAQFRLRDAQFFLQLGGLDSLSAIGLDDFPFKESSFLFPIC